MKHQYCHCHMVQKYQNEIPPIFYYGISTKTNEKDLEIPNLQALTLGRIIKMTLYNFYTPFKSQGLILSINWGLFQEVIPFQK